jgi:hypothetical protein
MQQEIAVTHFLGVSSLNSGRLQGRLFYKAFTVDRYPSLGHDRTKSNALIYLANSLHEVAFYRRR